MRVPAKIERFDCSETGGGEMILEPLGEYVRFSDYQALSERASNLSKVEQSNRAVANHEFHRANHCDRHANLAIEKFKAAERAIDAEVNAALEDAVRIARRNGATATALAIRKLLRPIEGETK